MAEKNPDKLSQNERNTDVRIVGLALPEVAERMSEHLSEIDYDLSCSSEEDGISGFRYMATPRRRGYVHLFLHRRPQRLEILLEQIGLHQTQVTLKASHSPLFRIFCFSAPSILLLLTFGMVRGFATYTPETHIGAILWALLALTGLASGFGLFLCCLNHAIHGHKNFLTDLYDGVAKDSASITPIHVGLPSYTSIDLLLFAVGVFLIIHTTMPWIPRSHLTAAIASTLVLVILLSNGRKGFRRGGAFASTFVSALVLGAYGLMPAWSQPMLRPIFGEVPIQRAISMAPRDRFFLTALVLALVGFVLIGIVGGIAIITPSHFTRSSQKQMTRDRTSWQRIPGGGRYKHLYSVAVIVIWAVMGGIACWAIYMAFGCIEIALPGDTRIIANPMVAEWAHSNRVIVAVMFGNMLPASWLVPVADMLLVVYAAPLIVLLALHIKEHLRLWTPRMSSYAPHGLDIAKVERAQGMLETISIAHGLRPPTLRARVSDSIDLHVGVFLFRRTPKYIFATTATLRDMTSDQLEALLAHEIGHIVMGHARVNSFLHFLSAFSPCGLGSLTVLLDPVEIERAADTFAIDWMIKQHGRHAGLTAVKNALTTVETSRISESINIREKKRPDLDEKPEHRILGAVMYIRRVLQAFRFDYREGWKLAYVHPTYSDRLNAISNCKTAT